MLSTITVVVIFFAVASYFAAQSFGTNKARKVRDAGFDAFSQLEQLLGDDKVRTITIPTFDEDFNVIGEEEVEEEYKEFSPAAKAVVRQFEAKARSVE